MKTAGIICEFNPFHEGHRFLIDNVRQGLNPDAVVCIMSGNFVQRGQPALWDKYERAEAAIKGGADIVLQMPICVSLSSAKYFAKGSIEIVKSLGLDYLCFGSECGDLNVLNKLASDGIEEIEEGNNILAAEYLRNLEDDIIPYTVKINDELGHASDIRNSYGKSFDSEVFKLLKYKITVSDTETLRKAPEVSEGIENRIKSVLPKAEDLNDLILKIKSKRYNYARISRMLMQILLDIENSEPKSPYAALLAFNDVGRSFLSQYMHSDNPIPIYSNITPDDVKINPDLKTDVKADDIYSIISDRSIYKFSDYVCKPVKTKI